MLAGLSSAVTTDGNGGRAKVTSWAQDERKHEDDEVGKEDSESPVESERPKQEETLLLGNPIQLSSVYILKKIHDFFSHYII